MNYKPYLILLICIALFGRAQSQDHEAYKWQFNLKSGLFVPVTSAQVFFVQVNVDFPSRATPIFDLSYYFSKHIAAELIVSASKHKVGFGLPIGLIDLGDVWLYPLNVHLQYHLNLGRLDPYIGAGVNWTHFSLTALGDSIEKAVFDPVFGFGTQLGLNYYLNDRWSLNFDIKKLFLSTNVGITDTSLLSETLSIGLKIDPWLFGIGLGFHF